VARRGAETAAAAALQTSPRRRDSTERLHALRANQVWAIDFQFDETPTNAD